MGCNGGFTVGFAEDTIGSGSVGIAGIDKAGTGVFGLGMAWSGRSGSSKFAASR